MLHGSTIDLHKNRQPEVFAGDLANNSHVTISSERVARIREKLVATPPHKMTVNQLKVMLTSLDAELPHSKKKKQFYVDLLNETMLRLPPPLPKVGEKKQRRRRTQKKGTGSARKAPARNKLDKVVQRGDRFYLQGPSTGRNVDGSFKLQRITRKRAEELL